MRRTGTYRRLALLALAGVMAVGSCANHGNPGLIVLGNMVPDQNCTVRAQGGAQQTYLTQGTLDLSMGNHYVGYMAVQNNYPELNALTSMTATDGRLDPATVTLKGFRVTLDVDQRLLQNADFLAGLQAAGISSLPIVYTTHGASAIEPGSSGVLVGDLIPPQIGQAFRTIPELVNANADITVVANVRAVGTRQDGKSVASRSFPFPIHMCNNCLIQHVYTTELATNPFNPPNSADALTQNDIGTACVLGQDDVLTNATCGAHWGGSPVRDQCKLDRCLGAAAATNLVCGTDNAVFTP